MGDATITFEKMLMTSFSSTFSLTNRNQASLLCSAAKERQRHDGVRMHGDTYDSVVYSSAVYLLRAYERERERKQVPAAVFSWTVLGVNELKTFLVVLSVGVSG